MNISLAPAQRRFVEAQVQSGHFADASDVVRHALRLAEAQSVTHQHLGGLEGGDLMALAFIVLMEAAKSAQEDLKAIMDGVKAINAAKRAHRELLNKVQRDLAASAASKDGRLDFSRGLGSERTYHRAPLPVLDPDAPGGVRVVPTDLYPGKIRTVADLQVVVDDLKSKLDSLSEMGEMESLRLQMAMDRLSKMMSTLSNLLHKLSDTAQAITQNIK
jgi:putative addiction module CopG family antidote